MQRTRRPPEVIQSSALDCGPAALSSLLRGLGAPAAYGQLRELCATDVDGTSIDSLEAVAWAAGTGAEQLVVPVEHVLALPEEYLPAIVVTVLPDGFTHFVVLWRLGRTHGTVMDPAIGIRRVPRRQLSTQLYRHSAPVPAAAWREWAGSGVFTTALRRRMSSIGVPAGRIDVLVDAAAADPGIEGLARLDGAVRRIEAGAPAGAGIDLDRPVDERHRSCVPVPGEPDQVILRGAVLLRARGWRAEEADPALLDRLSTPDPGPWRALSDRVPRWHLASTVVALGGLLLAVVAVAEQVVARRVIDGGAHATITSVLLVGLLAAIAAVGASWAATATGRRVEQVLRLAWWDAAARMPVSFVRSRPASDLAERGHLLHRLRELPLHLLQAVFAVGLVFGAVVAIVMVARTAALPLAALALGAVVLPLVAVKRTGDLDHRVRTLSGSLTRFVVDAVLGAYATRDGRTASSLRSEHETGLAAWRRASRQQVDLAAAVQGLTAVVTAAAAAWVVAAASSGPAANVLSVAAASLLVVDAGVLLAQRMRLVPTVRSVAARAAGPLQAAVGPERTGHGDDREGDRGEVCRKPPRIQLEKIRTVVGSVTILDSIDLEVASGEHVAIVGRSGSGKSSLLDVVLGITKPDEGDVVGAANPGDRSVAWAASTTRLWNDSLDANLGGTSLAPARAVPLRLAAFDAGALGDALHQRGDVRLGDAGGRLSDGEAQRIRLARAAGRPEAHLVVLDEAFRGLERERRSVLLRRTRRLWRHATLLCATHDLHDTLDFDRVVVLDGGAVVEVGEPRKMADDPGSAYARLLASDDPPAPGWNRLELRAPTNTVTAAHEGSDPTPSHARPTAAATDRSGLKTGQWPASAAWAMGSLLLTLVSVGMVVVAFRIIGRAALDGQVGGAAAGFGASLAVAGITGSGGAWCSGHLAISLGERYRRRTVDHALAIDPDAARGLGIGPALGWAIDVDLISTAMLGAATAAVLGIGELVAILVVASATAHAAFVRAVIVLALGVLAILAIAAAQARTRWTAVRTELTGRLVERIAGVETTRLQVDDVTASAEGQRFSALVDHAGRRMDHLTVAASAVPPVTTAILLVLAVGVRDELPGSAVLVGLALLAGLALQRFTFALAEIVAARDARLGLRALAELRSSRPDPRSAQLDHPAGSDTAELDQALLRTHQVTALHPGGGGLTQPVDLVILPGSRVLICGPSGCGKTTLGQLLNAERPPTTGTVSRRPGLRVVRVAQGQDCHLFQASLAFNLLAPVAWPPTDGDLARAEAILAEVGLDDLLSRMPSGLAQPIGDGGWRLSSGERARLSLTRALLQHPDVLVLDETTAPLDGEAKTQVLDAAIRHSKATVLIAHP